MVDERTVYLPVTQGSQIQFLHELSIFVDRYYCAHVIGLRILQLYSAKGVEWKF